jgi:hypothetical protein
MSKRVPAEPAVTLPDMPDLPETDEPEPDAETASVEAVLLSKCLGVLKEIRVLIQQALDR